MSSNSPVARGVPPWLSYRSRSIAGTTRKTAGASDGESVATVGLGRRGSHSLTWTTGSGQSCKQVRGGGSGAIVACDTREGQTGWSWTIQRRKLIEEQPLPSPPI